MIADDSACRDAGAFWCPEGQALCRGKEKNVTLKDVSQFVFDKIIELLYKVKIRRRHMFLSSVQKKSSQNIAYEKE